MEISNKTVSSDIFIEGIQGKEERDSDFMILKRIQSKAKMKWQSRLDNNITTLDELCEYFYFDDDEYGKLQELIDIHPVSITRYYAGLINPADPDDPVKKMIVPSISELDIAGSYDTSGEQENTRLRGLQHKYAQTALLLTTSRCAAYCRYCFRKRLVGLPGKEILSIFNEAVNYIKDHKEICNVLLSGGDPLVLSTEIIEKFLADLTSISHLKYIRIGSRTPVTFPYRILEDDGLVYLFKEFSKRNKRLYLVTHFNHPNELTEQSVSAVSRIINAGMIVNNQAVLLKGVNSDPAVLAELFKRLVGIGVNPYYLFQCRPVSRVKTHFQVTLAEGIGIVERAKAKMDGLSKRFRYCMSHKTGKIEIIGILDDYMYFKYHQSKNPSNYGKLFKKKLDNSSGWLEDSPLKDEIKD